MPALFGGGPEGGNQRPRGAIFAWIDSFILPDGQNQSGELAWTGDLKKALDGAAAEKKRTSGRAGYVFVDFTGETCTNCKLNERSVFPRAEVKELFKKFHLVQLFTDKVPDRYYAPDVRSQLKGVERQQADADINRWFANEVFGDIQLPLYVILEPNGNGRIDVVAKYEEGKINDIGAFVDFLKKPLNR